MNIRTSNPAYTLTAPREWLARQQGFRKRALWAHANSFEAFPPFAVAVIIAHLARAPQGWIDLLAVVFTVARIAYSALYILDKLLVRERQDFELDRRNPTAKHAELHRGRVC